MCAARDDAGEVLASDVLPIRCEYDWLSDHVAGSDCEERKACDDSVWAILDFRVFGGVFPPARDN